MPSWKSSLLLRLVFKLIAEANIFDATHLADGRGHFIAFFAGDPAKQVDDTVMDDGQGGW